MTRMERLQRRPSEPQPHPEGHARQGAPDHPPRRLRRSVAGLDRRLCHARHDGRGLSQRRVHRRRGPLRATQDLLADRALQPQGPGLGEHGPQPRPRHAEFGARHLRQGRIARRRRRRAASKASPISTGSSSSRASMSARTPMARRRTKSVVAVTPDHKDYAAVMGAATMPMGLPAGAPGYPHGGAPSQGYPASAAQAPSYPMAVRRSRRRPLRFRPSWAQ